MILSRSGNDSAALGMVNAMIGLGGWLADYVFEPFMASEHGAARILHRIVGSGAGSGMAVMFLCTGILGSVFSYLSYHRKEIQELRS